MPVCCWASIRPRPFSRGNRLVRRSTGCRTIASIRPRPFSRGNNELQYQQFKLSKASIRPRPFSRGNKLWWWMGLSFTHSFNSATTFQPWKRVKTTLLVTTNNSASIRPRPFSRGNYKTLRHSNLPNCQRTTSPRGRSIKSIIMDGEGAKTTIAASAYGERA